MKRPIYPEIEFVLSPEYWENVFIDKEGNEVAFEYPTYIPPRLNWMTYIGTARHYGWVNLDLQQVINDYPDKIVNDHKPLVIAELKHRFGF